MNRGFSIILGVVITAAVLLAAGGVFVWIKNKRGEQTSSYSNTNATSSETNSNSTNNASSNISPTLIDNVNGSPPSATGAVNSIATIANNNLQAYRILHLRTILESIKEDRGFPRNIAELSSIIKDCAALDRPASVADLSCAEINEESTKNTLVLEDVYTGSLWQYESSGSTYRLPFTIQFYPGMPDADKVGLVEGINVATEEIFSPQPAWNFDWTKQQGTLSGQAICYFSENPEIFNEMPSNQLTAKMRELNPDDLMPGFCEKVSDQDKKTIGQRLTTDADQDGLVRFVEDSSSLDDNNSDTDGDGFSDLQEIVSGYNPNGPGRIEPIF